MGRLKTVRRGAILVKDGIIRDVGRAADLRRKHRGARRVELGDRLLIPGFVDAHNHLPFLGSRAFELDLKLQGATYLDILAKGGGIHRTVRQTRQGSLNELVAACLANMDHMLASGTTTSEAKSGYGLAWEHERKQLVAVRKADAKHPMHLVPTFLGAHVVPRGADRHDYVREIIETMIPAIAHEALARFCDVFYERNAFTRRETERILRSARRHGLRLKLHADEFTNRRGARLAVELGCSSADHLMHVDADGIRALARSKTVAVLLPFVHRATFEDETAPARRVVDAGCATAIATDFNPNCHNPSMLEAFRAAVYDLRLRPAEALTAATLNAAWAIGEGDDAGSLENGKRADILVANVTDIHELAYRQGVNPLHQVIIDGVTVWRDGVRVVPA
jgi:imidazolonepropionase